MSKRNYVVCIQAEASSDIEVRKIYEVVRDELAEKRKYLRVVDDSGEDYLYPEKCFSPVQLPEKAIRVLVSLSATPRANSTFQPPSRMRKISAQTAKRGRASRG